MEIIWEELKTKKWCIDGVGYQETLEELLANASANHISNPLRLIGISHGNWHENNIIVTKNSDGYAYFVLEFAGQNDLINDAIMFLTIQPFMRITSIQCITQTLMGIVKLKKSY